MQRIVKIGTKATPDTVKATPQSPQKEPSTMFDIMFVENDENQTVEVIESTIIDFNAIIEQLEGGNSVFIAPKKQNMR